MEDRENRLNKLYDKIETWSDDEKRFVLWNLLKWCGNKLKIPKCVETIEDYRKEKVNRELWVSCNVLINMLNFEMWR